LFDHLENLPTTLATDIRRRFSYAINPSDSENFVPGFAASSILHPQYFALLPSDLFEAGRNEIEVWITRLPIEEPKNEPILTTHCGLSLLDVLPKQRSKITRPLSIELVNLDCGSNNDILFSSLFEKYEERISEYQNCEGGIYEFWQSNRSALSKLATVALQLLPAPATTSSCERQFSFAGLFTESRKANISPKNLESKLILAANKDLIEQLDPII
jgi:hypothetical protein